MKKDIPIYMYGSIIILNGIFLLFANKISIHVINFTLGISFILSAVFAIIVVFSKQNRQVQFVYHQMHAMALLVYGIAILFFSVTIADFISFTSFLFVFYAFSEISFCFQLFNLGKKAVYKIVIIRFLLGLVVGVGTFMAMHFAKYTLQGFGILYIIIGLNIVLYTPVIRQKTII